MARWRVAKAIKTLQAEVDKAHPDRPKTADGLIGDARHAATKSDHNPVDPHPGVVTAWDITTADFTVALAESLRRMGEAGDARVKYVIYRGQIAGPARRGWSWRPYSGFSQHFDHIHLSVSDDPKQYDRTDPWFPIPVKPKKKPAPPAPQPSEDDVTDDDIEKVADKVFEKLRGYVATHQDMVVLLRGTADGKHAANLTNIARALKVEGA
jgi:hypothetical protein